MNGDEDEKRTRKESLAKLHLFSFVLWEGGFYRGNKEWFRADRDIEKYRKKGIFKKINLIFLENLKFEIYKISFVLNSVSLK